MKAPRDMKRTHAVSFGCSLFTTLLLFTTSNSLANRPHELELNATGECEVFAKCDVALGSGTRLAYQELIHDTRAEFTVNVTCSSLLERPLHNVTISLQFGDTVRLVDSLQGGCAHFHLLLDPWKWGLLVIATPGGCVIYQRYLVTGYPPDVQIRWTCSVAADASGGGRDGRSPSCSTSPNGRRSAAARSHSVVCRYAAKQLRSLAAAGRSAARELAFRVEAELGVASEADFLDLATASLSNEPLSDGGTSAKLNRSETSRGTRMTCDEPDAAAEGSCRACWRPSSAGDLLNSRHVASLAVSNLLGAATTRQLFMPVDAVILGKPKTTIENGSLKANSVRFLFYPTKEPERLHLCFWNKSVEYMVLVQLSGAASEAPSSAITVQRPLSHLAVQTCSSTCCEKNTTEEHERSAPCEYCAVTIENLAPATEYSYQVSWRLRLEGDKDGAGRWSDPSVGSFVTAESAPSAAPTIAPGGFEYRACDDSCDASLGGSRASCVSLTVFWRDITPEQKNGRLMAFGVRVFVGLVSKHVARVPSNRRSYTICYESDWTLQLELTAETAAGQSPTSITTIDGSSSLLPSVSNFVVRHNESNTVDLWWSYTEPVESFILLWRSADEHLSDEHLSVLNWTTLDAATSQPTWRSGEKWHYSLNTNLVGNISFGHDIVYGVGAQYRGRHSGLTFNAQCAAYAGQKAPAAEVSAQQSTLSSTSIRLQVRVLWDDVEKCSFAGPLKGFEVKVTDDGSNITHDATCQGCVNDSGTDFENPENSFSIKIKDLVPNHSYLIAVRAVVDAGAAAVNGPYSTVVRVKTSGLKISEAVGVVIASLIVCGVLLLVTLLAPQCHRAIGFGQKLNVPTIKPATRDSMNSEFTGAPRSFRDFDYSTNSEFTGAPRSFRDFDDSTNSQFTGAPRSFRDFDYKVAHPPMSKLMLNDVFDEGAVPHTADSTVLLEISAHDSKHFDSGCGCWKRPPCRDMRAHNFSLSHAVSQSALLAGHPDFSSRRIMMADDWTTDPCNRFEDDGDYLKAEDVSQSPESPSSAGSVCGVTNARSDDCASQSGDDERMTMMSQHSAIRELKVGLVDSAAQQSGSSDLGYWQLNEVGELASLRSFAEHCVDRCELQPLQS